MAGIEVLRPTNSQTVIVKTMTQSLDQLDLFAGDYKEGWVEGYIASAQKFHSTFWPSDVRLIYAVAPASSKWFGGAYHRLKALGARKTGQYRNSTIEGRNGGTEWEWTWAK